MDRWRYVIPLRWRSLWRSSAVDRELDDELQFHIERQIELNVGRGMSLQDARRAALRAMDGVERHKEACRDQRGVNLVDHVMRDVRYGFRLLARSPIFTTVAILSLALGIGGNAAIFQLIDTVRLRNLAVTNPQELAEVRADGPQAFGNYDNVNSKVTYPLWEQIRAHQSAFGSLFAWGNTQLIAGRGAEARIVRGLWVSGDFFPVLGIAAERGRLLGPGDDRRGCGAGSAVISYTYWQTHFGATDAAIGSTLTLRDQPFTIVGVTARSFSGLEVGRTFDIALPVCSAALFDARLDDRAHWWLTVMGRLRPEWTIARADEQLRALSSGLLEATIPPGYGSELLNGYRRLRFGVYAASRGVSRLRDTQGLSLSLLLALTGVVLLITCGNIATLMMARATARAREIAVRLAMGAPRARVVSQMLIESLLVAAAGAALAVPVALVSARALVAFLDTTSDPIHLTLTADWRLIAFIGAVATLAAVLFGLVPALRVSTVDPITAMRVASRGVTLDRHRAWLQRGLVVVQIAMSLVLVVSALVFIQTFRNLAMVDTGFEQNSTVAVSFLDHASKDLPVEEKAVFQRQLTASIRSVPGVAAAASSTHVPLSGSIWSHFFRVSDGERKASRFAYVSPGYFDTLKISMRAGRDFDDFDTARSRRVMVVNESFVRSHLGGSSSVIGTTVRTIEEPGFPETTYEIIGVVGDTKYADLRDEHCWCAVTGGSTPPIAYVPIAQLPSPYAWAPVIVRASISPTTVTSAIARRVEALNPAIMVQFVHLETQIRERLASERMMASLAGGFAVLALTLVVVGVYGIIAYLAVSRTTEIGIRLSLGSTRAQIVGLVLRENLWLLGVGIALGIPVSVAAMRGAGALLFGLTPTDVPSLTGATCLLAAAGVLAGTVPAWRAARIRPDVALRCD